MVRRIEMPHNRALRLDLQINLLTEQENTQTLAILDAIAKKVGADLSNVPQVKVLREDTQPETLAQHIADMEEKMVTASERSENPADGRPQKESQTNSPGTLS